MYKLIRGNPFYFTVQVLAVGGIIPRDSSKSNVNFFRVYNIIIKVLFLICNAVAPLLHWIMSVRGATGVDISEDIGFTFGSFNALIICTLISLKWRQWLQLLHEFTINTEFGRHPGYDKLVKRMNRIAIVYTIFLSLMVSVNALNAYLASVRCKQLNEERGLHEICGTLTSLWLPFDISSSTSAAIFVLQVALFLISCAPCALIYILVFEAVELLISDIDNWKRHVVAMFDVPEETLDRVRFCVRYHHHIIKLARRLNITVMYTCGTIAILAALAIGCMGNQAFSSKSVGAVFYLMGYIVALFWICHAGQMIKDESFSMKDAVYASRWYQTDARFMRDLRFILARCQIPLCLETLPIGNLDYPLFLLIMKTAYSYMTLLSQTTSNT